MIRKFGRFGLVVATLLVFLLGSVSVVSAHDAAATLTCADQGVTLHIDGAEYPDGSTITYSIDGGASTTVSANGTYDIDAGSPTMAHTADVLFNSSDGLTQFNYHFPLSAEACVESPPSPPSSPPSAAPSAAPSSGGSEGPITGSPSPSTEVKGITGTPAPTVPPTDTASVTGAPSNDGWRLLLGIIAVATIAIFLATGRASKRSR